MEQERVDALEKEKTDSERIKEEEVKKRRMLQKKKKAEREKREQERIETERIEKERAEQERIEQERIETARLENEKLEKEKPEAERVEKEKIELQAKNERRRLRKEARLLREQEDKKKEHTVQEQGETIQSESQGSSAVKQKTPVKQEEYPRKLKSDAPKKKEQSAQDDKSATADQHKEQKQEQDGTYQGPVLHLQDWDNIPGQRKTTLATNSKSFEELPVLDHGTTKCNKTSSDSRSRSTSDHPNVTSLKVPEIVLYQQKGQVQQVPSKSRERSGRSTLDVENTATRESSSETRKDVEMKSKRINRSIEKSDEDAAQDRSTKKTNTSSRKLSSQKPSESRGNVQSPPSVLTKEVDKGPVLPVEENQATTNTLPDQDITNNRQQSTVVSDTRFTAVLQPDKNRDPEVSVPPSAIEKPREESTGPSVVQQDVADLVNLVQTKLDVSSASSPGISPSLSNDTTTSQGWMQRIRAISNYTVKAAEALTSRRGSLPGRLEHERQPDSSVKAETSQISRLKQGLENPRITNESEPELTARLYPDHNFQSRRTPNVPGGWKQDFDEPRLDKDTVTRSLNPKSQDTAAIHDTGPQIFDMRLTSSVEGSKSRRRSRDLQQESKFSELASVFPEL